METYWVPGVNQLGTHGRWAFAELRDVYQIGTEFASTISAEIDKLLQSVTKRK